MVKSFSSKVETETLCHYVFGLYLALNFKYAIDRLIDSSHLVEASITYMMDQVCGL